MNAPSTLDRIKAYYGETLTHQQDLKAKACCCREAIPEDHQKILGEIHEEVLERFYGCGSPIPPGLEGCRVLDLGCGTGRDTYLVSRLVGPQGSVIGVDMTEAQLAVGRRHQAEQARRFGYGTSNVDFRCGYIEDLRSLGIEDHSIDVVISNCVINLSPEKERVFSEIFRALKPGGELYFSDVFADRRMPAPLANDPVLRGECLGGAMYIGDFRRMLQRLGCPDYRVMSRCAIPLENPDIAAKVGMVKFQTMTIRTFKLSCMEDACEDFGQVAYYLGTLPGLPHSFPLDDHHTLHTGKPMLVCGNTAAMLSETRFRSHFRIAGDRSVHLGAFDCAPAPSATVGACC